VACGLLAVALALLDIALERWLTVAAVPLRFLPRVVLLATGAICGIRFFRDHARMAQENQFLRATHLETELQRLRDQINPHVVFNVLNSIHVLLHKDPQQASVVLLRFADMLRYQLYECAQPTIALAQEVGYLQSFVAVERIRWGTQLQVDCQWEAAANAQIAPFLLAPFVENAFKHISHHLHQENRIVIRLQVREEHLVLQVENTREPELPSPGAGKAGGIGLRNVQARLQLLYPGQHVLHLVPTPTHFAITLHLHLVPVSCAAARPPAY
jgi:LytS/YehU family sensor histidine kinase